MALPCRSSNVPLHCATETHAGNPKPVHNVRSCKASGRVNYFETGLSSPRSAVTVSGHADDVLAGRRVVQCGTPGSEGDNDVVWEGGGVLPTYYHS